MKKFIHMFALWLYRYGRINAGMASIRGTYETPVPQVLQQEKNS